jgi:hypothetical protein
MKRIEEHLYEHKHVIKDGQVTTRYYAKFTTWDRRPLTVALGDDLNAARVKLDRLHKLNDAKVRVELDEEKELREALARQAVEKAQERRGLTFAEWGQKYFDDIVYPKDKENPDCETADGIKSKSTNLRTEVAIRDVEGFLRQLCPRRYQAQPCQGIPANEV